MKGALTLTLITAPGMAVDASPLIPEKLVSLSLEKIRRLPLSFIDGKKQVAVADLFRVQGAPSERVIFSGHTERLMRVGSDMSRGTIDVTGSCGEELGSGMQGGAIKVHGDTADWAGASMMGGHLEIRGNASDHLGATRVGAACGMQGGLIFVRGACGDYAGDRLRRGTIIVKQDIGDYCASRMKAGTIIGLGRVGVYPGMGMQRGSLLFSKQPAAWLSSFSSCGVIDATFINLMRHLLVTQYSFLQPFLKKPRQPLCRFAGDLSVAGMGEIFLPNTE